jgi:opacity protein-like surface antigen
VSVEGGGGHVVFADDGAIDHAAFGARIRSALTSRISAGPELAYMRGPGRDRDLFIMGGVSFDVLRERRVTPYVTTAAGMMFHSDELNSWTDFAFIVGTGARIAVTDRFFVATEGRLGRPMHAGLGLSLGYRFQGRPSDSPR